MDGPTKPQIDAFIARWHKAGGSELANYQLFLGELIELLGLPKPDPAGDDTRDNAYVFERAVTFTHGDGSTSAGRIDLYRRGAFVCEAKKVRAGVHTKGFDEALLRARSQAEGYARALPAAEGRPPFVLVVDVGHVIELYAEFTRSGATYTPFPDPTSHRIRLADLHDARVRERLTKIWLDPLALDPAKVSTRVTREIAADLAEIAKSLEGAGHDPELVANFLSRCLFTLFAEDVGLLPEDGFKKLLKECEAAPAKFAVMLEDLWKTMDTGGFSGLLRETLLRFNGKLFKEPHAIALDRDQIGLLIKAAGHDWRYVEPAIFGTLLERALAKEERHKLGAHFTPRAYVERLVMPTVIEPLRQDWKNAQAAALTLMAEGDVKGAQTTVREFQRRLCEVRVLDPACGSGNFLYVTLEHMKRLEGEVLNQLSELGDKQALLDLAGVSVDPHQFLGIELNPRAAALAELVLWIGYLQWHFRTRGQVAPPEPVLKDFHNIECRDAVLAHDGESFVTDERGIPVTRWDGKTYKKHPVTGEDVPDEAAQVPQVQYKNPRKAAWPKADFVVGNPPFIGNKRMRVALGSSYVEALRVAWSEVPESADLVLYWWHHAATLTGRGAVRQFGLITTNSLKQTFNRRVVDLHLEPGAHSVSIVFAVPDHPWVDSADGAAVRISMTTAVKGQAGGRLLRIAEEGLQDNGEVNVKFHTSYGQISSDLRTGARVGAAARLEANSGICGQGVKVVGEGFYVDEGDSVLSSSDCISRIVNARDVLCGNLHGQAIIDFFDLTESEAKQRNPAAFQQVMNRVKPLRDQNKRSSIRDIWWRFAWERPVIRRAVQGLGRYFVTLSTSKHRFFVALDANRIWDGALFAIASEEWGHMGVLSSYPHRVWALAAGGTLEDRPTWTNSTCFEPFPFPPLEACAAAAILGQRIDEHRKFTQDAGPLVLTDVYNVLENMKEGKPLSVKQRDTHRKGLISILKELHDELDLAVLDAYGWSDLAPLMQVVNGNAAPGSLGTPATRDEAIRLLDETLLERLVALNAERAAEEKRGLIRWLRPEFQNPKGGQPGTQTELDTGDDETAVAKPGKTGKLPWPKDLTDQVKAVAEVLAAQQFVADADALAEAFSGRGRWRERLPKILDMLVAIGRARPGKDGKGFHALG